MPKVVWKYQWLSNNKGDDPLTCELWAFETNVKSVPDRLPEMMDHYGVPSLIERPEGLGLLFPNGGAWGLWVMTIEPD